MEFNVINEPDTLTDPSSTTDIRPEDVLKEVFDGYRDRQTGKIGVDVVIRPYDDPLSAFGDPDYYFQNKINIQHGLV
jgi:hypothetical protein